MDGQAPVSVRRLRREIHYRRDRRRGGRDRDLELLAVLRYGIRRAEPRYEGHSRPSENPLAIGWYGTYQATRLWGRWIQPDAIHRALRLALELDRPAHERSQDARYLEEALRVGKTHHMHHVNMALLACARSRLRMMREYLLHGAPIEVLLRRKIPIQPQPVAGLEGRLLAGLRVWLRRAHLDNPFFRWDVTPGDDKEPGPIRHRIMPFLWQGAQPQACRVRGKTTYVSREVPCWWLRARLVRACGECPDLLAALLDPVPFHGHLEATRETLARLLEEIEARFTERTV